MSGTSFDWMDGGTWHLTHRCHDRSFLLRFARDRDVYREWLRLGVRRLGVSLYGFSVTKNHVHVVAHAKEPDRISALMHLAAGATAKQFNLRKGREGAMWEHPFRRTRVEDGRHLYNCLCYVDLNMVRARAVAHPRAWRWCGYPELTGLRQRYRLLDLEGLVEALRLPSVERFREKYEASIWDRIASNRLAREGFWTDSVAVGSRSFVDRAVGECGHGRSRWEMKKVESEQGDGPTWSLRETRPAFGDGPRSGNR